MKNARDVLIGWERRISRYTRQESTFFRDFFQASCQVVSSLNNSLLLNQKDEEFHLVCERMKQMFKYLKNGTCFPRIPEEFYENPRMRMMIFAELTGDYSETRKKSRELVKKVETIEKAEDISQVRDDVKSLRDSFYNLEVICSEVTTRLKERGHPYSLDFAFA